MPSFIPYGRHQVNEEDISFISSVLKSDWLTMGPLIDQFEKKLSEVTKAKFSIACSNGTTALHLAVKALNIGPGDIVIVPSITFLATANAVRYVGGDVLFADVDPETGLLTAQTLQDAIEKCIQKDKIKAVVNVHFAGQCENLEDIYQVAKKNNLKIIDDASHAIGSIYVDRQGNEHSIGSNDYADLTTFSFHPVKCITTGEGGAITTNDEELAKALKIFRSHGMIRDSKLWLNPELGLEKNGNPNPWYYEMHEIGFNYRISDLNCALGLSQLNEIEHFKKKREEIVDFYDQEFAGNKNLVPLKKLPSSISLWHLYVLRIDFESLGKTRAEVMRHLFDNKIGTQVHYIPVYRQPYYEKLYGEQKQEGAEKYYKSCLSIPLYVGLEKEKQHEIVQLIKEF